MLEKILKNRFLTGLTISLIITAVLAIGLSLNFLNSLNQHFQDYLYTRQEPTDEIIIIAIDDRSTQAEPEGLGRFSQWSRDRYVELLDVLKSEEPKVIAFDLVFHTPSSMIPVEKFKELESKIMETESKTDQFALYEEFLNTYKSILDHPIDQAFAEKLAEFDNIVLAATLQYTREKTNRPLEKFVTETTSLGLLNLFLDDKGIIRKAIPRFRIEQEFFTYDDFALAIVKKYTGNTELKPPVNENGEMYVNFFGDPFSYKMVSYIDVVNKQYDIGIFRDKMVLIGITSLLTEPDEYYTPRSNVTPMSGIEFRANEIQTILQEKYLAPQSKAEQILVLAGISIVLMLLLNMVGVIASIIISVLAVVGYIAVAFFFYRKGILLNMLYPFFAIILVYLSSWVYKYLVVNKRKRQMKSAFSHYVSKEVVNQIGSDPDNLRLGGEFKPITIFFSDIKDSTTISESANIHDWVSQINEYFTVMEKIIKTSGGTLDKYEGDAIMAFWNAPLEQIDHVDRAFNSALEMKTALKNLHMKWTNEGKPLIEFRIGINTGHAIVGNFGSEDRFDYTAMGDTVNTASRLESSGNKSFGTTIMVAGFEGSINQDFYKKFVIRELDIVLFPGKREAIRVYELVCKFSEFTDVISQKLNLYNQGPTHYRTGNYAAAAQAFEQVKEDYPSQVMLARCRNLAAGQPVPELDENMVFKIMHK